MSNSRHGRSMMGTDDGNDATLPALHVEGAIARALDDERRARARMRQRALKAGLAFSIVCIAAAFGLVGASAGMGTNGVGNRNRAWGAYQMAVAEHDCAYGAVDDLAPICFETARALAAAWDRDPTPPAWVQVGDAIARFFGMRHDGLGGGDALEPERALSLVRGHLLFRRARGLAPLDRVSDRFERRAILVENSAKSLFETPGAIAFLRGALADDETAPLALQRLLDERFRLDAALVHRAQFPSSSLEPGRPDRSPLGALTDTLRAVALLDDDAVRAATRVIARTPGEQGERRAVLLWHARGEGALDDALLPIDANPSLSARAVARFLAPRVSRDGARAVPALARVVDEEASATKSARLAADLLLTLVDGEAKDAACARLLDRALVPGFFDSFSLRPVLACTPPADLMARLSSLAQPTWRGDGHVMQALATLYGARFVPSDTGVVIDRAREAHFADVTGLAPRVFTQEQTMAGGVVTAELSCSERNVDECLPRHLPDDLAAVQSFIRAMR